ncbi:MAG: DUF423 domain-containing protein [Casimicrobiaceae bacterium]
MTPRGVIVVAAGFLLLGVGAGAFGAHALRSRLSPDVLAVFATGVQYHLVHALGLLIVGVLWRQWPAAGGGLAVSAALLAVGIVLFSGSLYVLALTGVRGWGAVTPVGGLAWLLAWAILGVTAWRYTAAA